MKRRGQNKKKEKEKNKKKTVSTYPYLMGSFHVGTVLMRKCDTLIRFSWRSKKNMTSGTCEDDSFAKYSSGTFSMWMVTNLPGSTPF